MDDLLEASGDLVVADLALFAGHDFAELPDSLHRGAPLRRTVEASISLVDSSQPIRDRHRFLSPGASRERSPSFSKPNDEMFKYYWLLRTITSIPPQRAVPWIS